MEICPGSRIEEKGEFRGQTRDRPMNEDSMDGNATVKTDVAQTAEHLTGKQRALRGVRYFCAVFAVVFVIGALRLSSKDNPYLLPCLAVLGIFCFPPALVAGLGVMAFRQRRRWHWAVMALVAAGCVVATAVASILLCLQL